MFEDNAEGKKGISYACHACDTSSWPEGQRRFGVDRLHPVAAHKVYCLSIRYSYALMDSLPLRRFPSPLDLSTRSGSMHLPALPGRCLNRSITPRIVRCLLRQCSRAVVMLCRLKAVPPLCARCQDRVLLICLLVAILDLITDGRGDTVS